MPSKLRRHIGNRTSSFAKEIAKHATKDPRLRFSIVQVALACTGLANQMQQVAASCKNAQQTFAGIFPEDSDARAHAIELFENLGMLIMHSAEGPLTEAIETLLVVAIRSASSEAESRTMSIQASSLGLDTADIALDEEDLPRHPKSKAEAADHVKAPSTSLTSSSDRLRLEAVAQVAITRRLPIVGAEADGTKLVLVGYTEARSRAERLCELDCDFSEAQRIVVIVSRMVEKGLA